MNNAEERNTRDVIALETRVTAFIESLARACKNCRYRGATCSKCSLDGVESLAKELNLETVTLSIGKTETRKRKDTILKILSTSQLPARKIILNCTRDLKYATLRAMVNDGEIESVHRKGKQNLYRLPTGKTTTGRKQ